MRFPNGVNKATFSQNRVERYTDLYYTSLQEAEYE
jgi:hypothetical protein